MNARLLFRRLLLLGTPLILVVVGFIHPGGTTLSARAAAAEMTFVLHLLLIPVFSLIGLAGCCLTSGLRGRAVRVSRTALGMFAILYVALDTFAGVSQGGSFLLARTFPAEQQAALYEFAFAVLTGPLGSGVILGLFVAGTLAWIVGLSAAAIALGRSGVAREPRILMLLAGVLLIGDHSTIYGSLAFGCFFLAAAWLEFAPQPGAHRQSAMTLG
jgi:hypothetical protein